MPPFFRVLYSIVDTNGVSTSVVSLCIAVNTVFLDLVAALQGLRLEASQSAIPTKGMKRSYRVSVQLSDNFRAFACSVIQLPSS